MNYESLLNLNSRESLFLQHSMFISIFSPITSLYQTCKLFDKPFMLNLKLVPRIFLPQIALRYTQTYLSSTCKDVFNPVVAFGIIGILQGGVYGHSNLYFSDKLHISHNIHVRNYFKGPIFAATRDIVSQGIPFYLSPYICGYIHKNIDRKLNTLEELLVLSSLSISTTYLSHPFHCLQTFIQNNPNNTQFNIAYEIINKYKWSLFYKGITGRLVLLLAINVSNHIFLRQLWNR